VKDWTQLLYCSLAQLRGSMVEETTRGILPASRSSSAAVKSDPAHLRGQDEDETAGSPPAQQDTEEE